MLLSGYCEMKECWQHLAQFVGLLQSTPKSAGAHLSHSSAWPLVSSPKSQLLINLEFEWGWWSE